MIWTIARYSFTFRLFVLPFSKQPSKYDFTVLSLKEHTPTPLDPFPLAHSWNIPVKINMRACSSRSPHGCRNETALPIEQASFQLPTSIPTAFTSTLSSDHIQPMPPTHKIHNGKWDCIFSLSTETLGMNLSSVHSLNGYLEAVQNVLVKSQQTYQS